MILLSDLIQPLDQLGFAGDAQFLTLGEQELLIDQVAQQVGLLLLQLAGRNGLLPGLCGQLFRGSIVV